ncbi:hypothetical protein GCM10020295_19740 [Streptomyces cinereospinus]
MESFGTRLRRYRSEQQCSLSDLSARTHYSAGHLSKVENGLRTPTRELAASCDAALGARGGLLAALGAGRPGDAARGAAGAAGSAPAAAAPDDTVLPAPPATLTDGAAASVIAALTTVLDGLRATAQSAGPGAVLESAAAQVRALRGMAAHARAPEAGHLLSLAGRYAEFIAWMCQEADDERSALGWARTTASLARHVGSPDIEANAVLRRSLLALYCDDGAATVDLASAAAGFPASPATRVRALLRLAQGHALSGDDLRCRRALDDAYSLLSSPAFSDPAAGPVTAASHGSSPGPVTSPVRDGAALGTAYAAGRGAVTTAPGTSPIPPPWREAGASRCSATTTRRSACWAPRRGASRPTPTARGPGSRSGSRSPRSAPATSSAPAPRCARSSRSRRASTPPPCAPICAAVSGPCRGTAGIRPSRSCCPSSPATRPGVRPHDRTCAHRHLRQLPGG